MSEAGSTLGLLFSLRESAQRLLHSETVMELSVTAASSESSTDEVL